MTVVVIGGTAGLGLEIVRHYAQRGEQVVLSGRSAERAAEVAAEVGDDVRAIGLDLAQPETIADRLAPLDLRVSRLVLAAIDRDHNTVTEYDLKQAAHLVTLKLIGYTEVIHALLHRIPPDGSILLFGGQAKERPYPGSTTVTTINHGVMGMVNTLASELAPIRVNAIHPGIVGDSPYWQSRPPAALEAVRARTPTGRLVTMAEVANAAAFLLDNTGVNAVNLAVDGGWLLR
jgi:NAD(P)-dependent dehydrogenase (short-subunit alcohol dehydrogenase family)